MDPAVGVVLGALIGAGGTVVTTLSAARTARVTMDNSGASWLAKVRDGDAEAAEERRQNFTAAHNEFDVTEFASASNTALNEARA